MIESSQNTRRRGDESTRFRYGRRALRTFRHVRFNPRCLVDLQRHDPLAFLKQIFAFYPRVRVISAFEDDETLDSAEKVMAYWEKRNREITAKKLLPDRMLHFDLVTAR